MSDRGTVDYGAPRWALLAETVANGASSTLPLGMRDARNHGLLLDGMSGYTRVAVAPFAGSVATSLLPTQRGERRHGGCRERDTMRTPALHALGRIAPNADVEAELTSMDANGLAC